MSDLVFWSVDRRFGLRVSEQGLDGLRTQCREVEDCETGGILVGYYTESLDCAVVTAVSRPPRDSSAGPTWFYRGTAAWHNGLIVCGSVNIATTSASGTSTRASYHTRAARTSPRCRPLP
jgi:hypothetical protein